MKGSRRESAGQIALGAVTNVTGGYGPRLWDHGRRDNSLRSQLKAVERRLKRIKRTLDDFHWR
jgi:hypothetical protein